MNNLLHGQLPGDPESICWAESTQGYTYLTKFDQARNSGLAVGQAILNIVGLRLKNKLRFNVNVILIDLYTADA